MTSFNCFKPVRMVRSPLCCLVLELETTKKLELLSPFLSSKFYSQPGVQNN